MFQFNDFCAAFALNTFISLTITVYSWLKLKSDSGKYFSFLMLSVTIWAFAGTFELSFTTLEQKIFWSKVSYIGIVSVSPLWFLFSCHYTRTEKKLTLFLKIVIWIIPIIILSFAFTNELHGYIWPKISLTNSGIGIIAIYQHGWGKFVLLLYSYMLLTIGTVILITFAVRSKDLYSRQVYTLIIAALVPWVGNALYYFRIGPFAILDFTPVIFNISGLLHLWNILNFRLLDIMPVAHDTLFENMSDGVIVIDKEDRIIEINPQAKNLFLITDSVGHSFKDKFAAYPEISSFINSTDSGSTELSLNISDCSIWLDVRVTAIINSDKKKSGKLIVLRDITQKKNSELELAESERKYRDLNDVKDKFLRIISHDLKSPFQGLLGLSKLLAEDIESLSKDEIKEFSYELNQSIQSQYRLLDDLLSLSKVQSEKIRMYKKPIQVSSEIKNLFELYGMLAQSKQIQQVNNITDDITINADPDMFRLMLRNLISNALKFTQQGGTVAISLVQIDNKETFIVEDTGVGIAEQDIPKLFRLDNNFTTKGTRDEKGTGFGLIFCKEVIEKHDGKIWLESEVGKGSKFYFSFPK